MVGKEKEIVIALCKYFLSLGATGYGGPLALIQQMRHHFVNETKQITVHEFDHAFTLIKAMPGPIAFQMAVFCSQHLAGRLAGILAGFSLLLPAFCLMLAAGIGYKYLSGNYYVSILLNGFQFAVAAVIFLGLKTFFLQYFQKKTFWIIVLLAAVLYFRQSVPEPVIIIGFGLICTVGFGWKNLNPKPLLSVGLLAIDWELLWKMFKVCTYAGAFVFGTGLALLPVLQQQFVVHYHWLSLQVFNDGVTFGQMTPGPVTITATFLGYKVAGFPGAVVATAGIFLLPLFHMITWFPKVLNWLSRQHWINDFLLGATSAVVGVLLITVYKMNEGYILSMHFWIIFFISFVILLVKPRLPVYRVIVLGGFINLVITFATMNTI